MTRQDSLFAPADLAPRKASPVAPAVQTAAPRARPDGWRAPTQGEHVCGGCAGAACYGLGESWFCRACVPAGFLPEGRAA